MRHNEQFLVDNRLFIWDKDIQQWIRLATPRVLEVYYDYPEKGIATVEVD